MKPPQFSVARLRGGIPREKLLGIGGFLLCLACAPALVGLLYMGDAKSLSAASIVAHGAAFGSGFLLLLLLPHRSSGVASIAALGATLLLLAPLLMFGASTLMLLWSVLLRPLTYGAWLLVSAVGLSITGAALLVAFRSTR